MISKNIVHEMTLEEKVKMLTGEGALSTASDEKHGIKSINMSDGPHGVRRLIGHLQFPQTCSIEGGDTCVPTASAMGASWNRGLMFEVGRVIAKDCIKEDISVLLAPAVNMKRTPHCGRNFEYISEDPYLSGILGAEFINGVQSLGVGTSLKHFAANNQEIKRGTINAEIDERTLREHYLRVFDILLKHCNPTSVMCAYNKLNGIWCSENKYLLTEILRKEWKYDGLVVSDWGAVHDICKALNAGLDLQMPKNENILTEIKTGLDKGLILMETVDRAVENVIDFLNRLSCNQNNNKVKHNREEQHICAYKAACETITLLRNENGILPINNKKYKKIAVLGRCAEDMLFMGGGSSKVTVDMKMVEQPLKCIKDKCCENGIDMTFLRIFEDKFTDESVVHTVESLPDDFDCAIFFVGDNYGTDCETESFDRDNLKLPNYMNAAIEKAVEKFKNLVIVMQSGCMILPFGWDNAPCIVQMWYSGEGAGKAIADILFGDVNPSGKLSETFVLKERTDIQYPGDRVRCEYLEKTDVGYRYYDKHRADVWFPFGHGLSYTEFEYSNLYVSRRNICESKFKIDVTCSVKNVGGISGKEVVQLYIMPLDSVVSRPIKELKGFCKEELNINEEKNIKFELSNEDFEYYNTCLHSWHIESGRYRIMVGASLHDIRLYADVFIKYDEDYTKYGIDGSMIL